MRRDIRMETWGWRKKINGSLMALFSCTFLPQSTLEHDQLKNSRDPTVKDSSANEVCRREKGIAAEGAKVRIERGRGIWRGVRSALAEINPPNERHPQNNNASNGSSFGTG